MSPRRWRHEGFMKAFSACFPLYYTVAFYRQFTLFSYYPLVGEFHIDPQPTTLGPSMAFYSWVLAATTAATLTAMVLPARWRASLWPGWLWLGPMSATVFTFVYEGRWLLPATSG
jgi:hypothetical protein